MRSGNLPGHESARVSMTTSLRARAGQFIPSGGVARATIVVFGALAVLQSSQELDVPKVIYLAVAALAVSGSILAVWRTRSSGFVTFARPWLVASGVVSVLIAASLPVALVHGTPFSSWIRDAAAYAIVVAAPWVAIDLATSASRRFTLALLVLGGGLAAGSYAIVWIQRRAIADLPIDRVTLPSFTLAMVLFAVAVALSVTSDRRQLVWSGLASVTIGLLIIAGTRTTLALLVIPPVVIGTIWLSEGKGVARRALVPGLTSVVVTAVILVATQVRIEVSPGNFFAFPGGPGSSPAPGASPTPPGRSLGGRFGTFDTVIAGRDDSFQERLTQTRAAWDAFLASPIVGQGLGATVTWVRVTGATEAEFTADTPVLVLTKFGILGLGLVAVIGWAIVTTIRNLSSGGRGTNATRLSFVAVAAGIVALTPFGWQLEDKGTGLAIILLLAFALSEARDAGLIAGDPVSSRVWGTSRARDV
jgi:hypothetical protein